MSTADDTDRVIDGVDSTLDLLEKVPVGRKSRPITEIKLYNVGFDQHYDGILISHQITIHANPVADNAK